MCPGWAGTEAWPGWHQPWQEQWGVQSTENQTVTVESAHQQKIDGFGFFRVEEGVHLIWVRAAQRYVWVAARRGRFLILFSSHSLKQWSHEWINSPKGQQKNCLFFPSLSEFPAGFPCWADSPQSGGVTGAVTGSPEWCWGDVMFCQMDVTPVQSLLGLHAMTLTVNVSLHLQWRRTTSKK